MKMNLKSSFVIKIIILIIGTFHILLCPFTKVEESFNLQAIHDLFIHKLNTTAYDHNEFSGVVSRSFIGPLIVTSVSWPLTIITLKITNNLFFGQLVARYTLFILVLTGLFHFTSSLRVAFRNANIEKLTLIITAVQFHFIFYASRTLPNTFALIFFLHATSFWLKNKQIPFIWLSALSIIIFRSELCIICGIMLIISLVYGKCSIKDVIINGLKAAGLFIASTLLIDSYFWGYWVWPEGQVFWFNTFLNKSSQWGTLPFFWYFYSAIPRGLLLSVVFVPLSLILSSSGEKWKTFVYLFVPSIGFVSIYSMLPHKELRFIIYVFPLLNAMAAKGFDDV
jgi:alpha-1,6-mannosyltransferase